MIIKMTITVVGDIEKDLDLSGKDYCGVLIQYPDTYGGAKDWTPLINKVHADFNTLTFSLYTY